MEAAYRGMDISVADSLKDTILAALSVATRGKAMPEDYEAYKKGIRDVRGHIYAENFSAEIAAVRAPKIIYLAASLISNDPFERVSNPDGFLGKKLNVPSFKAMAYLRKYDAESYAYAVKADRAVDGKIKI